MAKGSALSLRAPRRPSAWAGGRRAGAWGLTRAPVRGHSPAPVGVQHSDSSDSNDGSSGSNAEEAALAILGLLRDSGRRAGESLLPPRSAGVRGLCLRRVTSSYLVSP